MRETIVTELWAHGLDELARLACDVDARTIEDIVARGISGGTGTELAGTALVRRAIAVLTGEAASGELKRSRSPVFDMPEGLRYAAYRAETTDILSTALDTVRHRRGEWRWLVLAVRDTDFYVQFSSWPGPGIAAEAVGAGNVDPGSRHAVDEVGLERLGWTRPSDIDDRSAGNWYRRYRSPGREDLRAIATSAIETLEIAYGVRPPARFDLDAGSWPDDAMPPPDPYGRLS